MELKKVHRVVLRRFSLIVILLILIVSLFVSVGSISSSSRCVAVVEDVIVGFVDAPDLQLLAEYNVVVVETFSIIPAVHAIVPQSSMEALRQNPKVAYVAENSQMVAAGVADWPLQKIGVTDAVWTSYTGAGVKIALLDSGIAPIDNLRFHVGYNFIDNNFDTTDVFKHGTLIASLIAMQPIASTGFRGVAPEVELYAVKVLDDNGRGSLAQALSGVQWAVENKMQIISISWCIVDQYSVLKEALDKAYYEEGILIVAAVGNTGNIAHGVGCPANYDSTIAVSAINEAGSKLRTACTGEEVELTAPGEGIYSIGPNNQVAFWEGTSFAVPYVVGTAALVWAKNTSLTNIEVRNILCQTAIDLQPNDGKDRDIFFGYGLINATAALQITTPTGNNNNNNGNNNNNQQSANPSASIKVNSPEDNWQVNPIDDNYEEDSVTDNLSDGQGKPSSKTPSLTFDTADIIVIASVASITVSITIVVFSAIRYLRKP